METLREELDSDQVELVSEVSDNLLVLAGPGSGKTRVIIHRIAYLFRANFVRPPHMVLGVTFTNKAAAEMRLRVRQVSSVASQWSHIMTFHKFGENFLRNYGYLKALGRDFVIYDERLQAIALEAAAKEVSFRNLDARGTVSVIEKLKAEHGSAATALEALRASGEENFADLMAAYEHILRSRNAVDHLKYWSGTRS
jgi:DNA helicase II / ATP-dependent DNA helicase PcrA